MRPRVSVLLLAALAAGCTRGDSGAAKAPATPHYLAGVARYPESAFVSRSTAPDVEQLTFTASVPADSVAAFYRRRLPASGWSLLADTGDSLSVALYAERDGQPLWVQVSRIGPLACRYTLISAGKARSAAPPARAAPPPG
jgi:hypothetical protein